MKCIKKGALILRVTDRKAEKFVRESGFKYVPKKLWKAQRGTGGANEK
uniref:Uncharacterized protein n=1 Tax=viral metagenome TaxID=1070528 RepID=A0A6H1ZME0_9ZZZZ